MPDAPVESAALAIVMSMRPPVTCCENVALTPPDRMKVPSDTLLTRKSAGSNVRVNVTVDSRAALITESGTVYGPPPTRNVVPDGVIVTCAIPRPGDVIGGGATGVGRGATVGGPAGGSVVAAGGVVVGCVCGGVSTACGGGVAAG